MWNPMKSMTDIPQATSKFARLEGLRSSTDRRMYRAVLAIPLVSINRSTLTLDRVKKYQSYKSQILTYEHE
ncbi:uncharacterized protein BDW43DRAFT_263345 [Aspergillus alliaceus]|uniref:uncharacterized protein n=1 Tax=Petromyces alliaceus TaxID=209559 RepID=UPI0012A5F6CE|nr:uncharacterized protein BDW43DRAFT_263345 [Aspergillus alliaceus]KAB8238258.1 hypothetical protein BDW43DRAFT_263345 [Aspergillus alliaceus]